MEIEFEIENQYKKYAQLGFKISHINFSKLYSELKSSTNNVIQLY